MFGPQGCDAGMDGEGLSGGLLEILPEAEVPPFRLDERFGRGGLPRDVDGPAFAMEVRPRHRPRAAPPFVEEVLRILDPDGRAFVPRGLGEGGHLELEEEQGLLADEVEPRIEHLEGGSMEQVRERSMGLPQLRIEDVLRQARRGDGDREEARTPLSDEGPQLRDRERLQWPREEESLARRGEVLAGGVDEGRELFDAHRAGDVAVRVDRIDNDQRLREGPRGRTLQHDDGPGPPGKAAVQDAAEAAVLQDEELAEVAAESEDLGLGPVHADPFGPRLQESDLVRLALLHMSEDIVNVEGRAVDGAHALGRVRDPIAGEDLDLEAAVPAAGERVLRAHPHGPLEHVAEGEALPLEDLPWGVGRE